jgi:uncharacterized membrane protein (DUF106 family)
MDATIVTQEELKNIQQMTTEFNQAKMALGDIELQKQSILKSIEAMRLEFAHNERKLIEKYGEDAVINVQTGQITKKKNG